ncbi:cytochrome b/b6 domain-containing protein [Microbacterium esteraromaticum]|uniref:cytochrome b/b6 domain-containing protein n=1 Tax=Microbacterium esteraromaticum TaxID=57043 RepID=UPI0030B0B212
MAGSIRRGLPRVKGGEPWPPATEVEPADAVESAQPAELPTSTSTARDLAESTAPSREQPVPSPKSRALDEGGPDASVPAGVSLRRGLPRVPGGEPWPPADSTAVASVAAAAPEPAAGASSERDLGERTAPSREQAVQSATSRAVDAEADARSAHAEAGADAGVAVRRGLPRVAGGEPWPPARTVPVTAQVGAAAATQEAATQEAATHEGATTAAVASEAVPATDVAATTGTPAAREVIASASRADVSTPLPYPRTVWQGRAPRHAAEPLPEPSPLRPTWPQAIGGLLGLAALGLLAVAAVFLVRTFLSFPVMQDFLATYPGEYHPAVDVEPGFAPWANWAHFFNMFLMVLIIRSGLRVRSEKRPTVFWTPRGNAKGKISLTLWFHQALDLLWIINGVVFVVLLVTTGHWARIVPTSWEVFPNALSAGLQYLSFDWPTDNGWVNYNSLQQLAYFVTVFIAAPLAIVTGFRMSGLWPKKAERLSKAYPVEWARALHFPVMLYFVAFIIVHVALVFLTGALRNLNHMFAAQGSVDGAAYAANWTGFWVFVLAMAVIAGGWFAARPLVLAPIAKLFGQVSGR